MRIVNVHEAKTHLSRLLDAAAKLVAIGGGPVRKRKLGGLEGRFTVPDDFDDPLPDEILALFYGRDGDEEPVMLV